MSYRGFEHVKHSVGLCSGSGVGCLQVLQSVWHFLHEHWFVIYNRELPARSETSPVPCHTPCRLARLGMTITDTTLEKARTMVDQVTSSCLFIIDPTGWYYVLRISIIDSERSDGRQFGDVAKHSRLLSGLSCSQTSYGWSTVVSQEIRCEIKASWAIIERFVCAQLRMCIVPVISKVISPTVFSCERLSWRRSQNRGSDEDIGGQIGGESMKVTSL